MNQISTKKDISAEVDELRQEYDKSVLKDGVRSNYLARYRSGTNLALLAPDVRAAYPTDDEVNRALRKLMNQPDSQAVPRP